MPPDELPQRIESGFQEIQDNFFAAGRTEEGRVRELDDLDGVGQATEQDLKDAGVRDTGDLVGLSQDELAAVDGIGSKRAAKIRTQVAQRGNRVKNESRTFRDDDIKKATAHHAERPAAERRTDESFNAKISLNYDQWKENPAKYDMPGVDTIPRERRLQRTREAASELAQEGLLDAVDASASGPDEKNASGIATGGRVSVQTAQNDPESTLAHELGHIADRVVDGGRAGLTNKIFGSNTGEAETERQQELREQGAALASRRRRGGKLNEDFVLDKAEQGDFGGGGFNEVLADAFAEVVEEPRRAKSEAPDLVREIETSFFEESDRNSTPF